MGFAKRMMVMILILLVLMMNAALAEVPFLMHSNGWTWEGIPVDVLLKADVNTHMPFDEDRLAMLTPITDMLTMRLVTGDDEGLVSISAAENELLTLQYKGKAVQLSSMPDVTYTAEADPMSVLLGEDVSADGVYELLELDRRGETLITDGRALLEKLVNALAEQGKKAKNTTSISGYGRAAYTMEYSFTANKAEKLHEALLENCPEGWLKEIISCLTFSGKQTIRVHFSQEDAIIRAEYNGTCGTQNDLRTVKLIYKFRHDMEMEKDHIELTSPAKKGKNKNTLTFDRTVQTNKSGARSITGSFKYTKTKESITSVWDGTFGLFNAYNDQSDVLTGEFTLEKKLNGAEKVDAITLTPNLTISGTAEEPVIQGTLTIEEKYAGRITEQAAVSIDLKRAQPLAWNDTAQQIDLSAQDEAALAQTQRGVAASLAEAVVRPLILKMGKDAQWFFRDLSDEVVQSILDAAASR